jgi:outer membrane protein TolC
VVTRRQAQLEQARLNVQRVRERLGVEVDKAYRKAGCARRLVDVAAQALAATKENERTVIKQVRAGFASESKGAEALAAVSAAEFKAAQARVGYELAVAELERTAGVVLQLAAGSRPVE